MKEGAGIIASDRPIEVAEAIHALAAEKSPKESILSEFRSKKHTYTQFNEIKL